MHELRGCGSPQVLTCTYAGPLLAYERFMIAITVTGRAGCREGVSEVSVSGGGAAGRCVRGMRCAGRIPVLGLVRKL